MSKVVKELAEFSQVDLDDNKSQVSIIGKNIVSRKELLHDTMDLLKNNNVYMISQGATYVNISFVVDRGAMAEVVRDMHRFLFE